MNFTIEQKENITTILAILHERLERGADLALCIENTQMWCSQSQLYARNIRELIETSLSNIDRLKQYLMEIDER